MKKKLLSLLLALCLMLTLLPFGASASAQTIRQTYVNPVYADVLSERDLVSGRGQLRAAAAASQTPEEAAAALREQLKNRAETISISVHIPSRDDEVGQTVSVTFMRGKEEKTVDVTLGSDEALQEQQKKQNTVSDTGSGIGNGTGNGIGNGTGTGNGSNSDMLERIYEYLYNNRGGSYDTSSGVTGEAA